MTLNRGNRGKDGPVEGNWGLVGVGVYLAVGEGVNLEVGVGVRVGERLPPLV